MQVPLPFPPMNRKVLTRIQGSVNQQIFLELCQQFKTPGRGAFYLFSQNALGKTHLLRAICTEITESGYRCDYFPLKQLASLPERPRLSVAGARLMVLDDLDAIAAKPRWEEQLFHFFNRMHQSGCPPYLLMSGRQMPAALGLHLPDLTSRLLGSATYRIQPMRPKELKEAIFLHAQALGVQVSLPVVLRWLADFSDHPKRIFAALDTMKASSLRGNTPDD